MAVMTSGPGFRLARAVIFAAVCVLTTALGHALMAGAPLPGWMVGYAFAATSAGAWWLTGRERGVRAVTGATIAAQFALHAGFGLAAPAVAPPADGATSGMRGMPGMAMDHAHAMAGPAASAGQDWSAGMVLAHALAALACGLWLWRGEAAAFRLGRALAAFVFAPLRGALRVLTRTGRPVLAPRQAVRYSPKSGPCLAPLHHAVTRRGPPGQPVRC
jgi:hypothetical protein